jgi:hypothetical protein
LLSKPNFDLNKFGKVVSEFCHEAGQNNCSIDFDAILARNGCALDGNGALIVTRGPSLKSQQLFKRNNLAAHNV